MSKEPDVPSVLTEDLSRRKFLGTTAAMAGGAASLSLIPGTALAATQPRKGGTARIGVTGASTGDSLDPATMYDMHPYNLTWMIRNNLTELATNGDVVPELAESWEASADFAKWTFKLRRGVEFHNGKTMTADDVAASIHHHIGKDSRSGAKGFLSDIDEVVPDGKYNAVFRLKKSNSELPALLTDMRVNVMPEDGSGGIDFSGVGTGGYVLKSYDPGVRAEATRNPNYWKEGRAHFDAVELIALNDDTARLNALRSGVVDIMNRVPSRVVSLVANTPGIRILELPSAGHFNMPMNVTKAPFDNVDVRLALKYAIDRQALVDGPLNGHAVVGNDHPIARTYKYFAADIPQRTYDPDRAKHHLKKAGHDSLKLTLHTSVAAGAASPDAAALMKEHARPTGIDIAITQAPADGYWYNVWRKVPWCMSLFSGRATAGAMFSYTLVPTGGANETFYDNDRFTSLLAQALKTDDDSRRRELYREMQMLIRDDGGTMTWAFQNITDACTDKVQQGELSPISELDGYRAAERWWFA